MDGQGFTVNAPDFGNSKFCINRHAIECTAADFDFDRQVGWRVEGEVKFQFSSNRRLVLNPIAAIGFQTPFQVLAAKCRTSTVTYRKPQFGCEYRQQAFNHSIDVFMDRQRAHQFDVPSVESNSRMMVAERANDPVIDVPIDVANHEAWLGLCLSVGL